MSEVAVLNEVEVPSHLRDEIDEIAAHLAEELVDRAAETIQTEKARVVVSVWDKLNAQYAGRRVGNTLHVGDVISEVDVIATRTADWKQLDEVFTKETIYDPVLKQPMSRYKVEMFEGGDSKTVVELHSDGEMRFVWQQGDHVRRLTKAEADVTMLDLVYRAEMAVGAYEMRKEAAAEQGLDPRHYSDAADTHARRLLAKAGYLDHKRTPTE